MRKILFTIYIVLATVPVVFCQQNKELCVAFYNVENLFDTINTYNKEDYEYLPTSTREWNTQKYTEKLHYIARVIIALNDWRGADIIGLAEVENRQVLEDLVQTTYLRQLGYGIVHKESPDKRGIDVAMLYKKNLIELLNVNFVEIRGFERPTRDILCSSLLVHKDTLNIIVSHWPSKYGGKAVTVSKRKKVGEEIRKIADSLNSSSTPSKIIITGDFNDEPAQESVRVSLGATADSTSFLFNTSIGLSEKGDYTHKYQHSLSVIDQIVISSSLLTPTKGWKHKKTGVFKPQWLIVKDDKFGGEKPFRSFYGKQYLGGYSDHFPVFTILEMKR